MGEGALARAAQRQHGVGARRRHGVRPHHASRGDRRGRPQAVPVPEWAQDPVVPRGGRRARDAHAGRQLRRGRGDPRRRSEGLPRAHRHAAHGVPERAAEYAGGNGRVAIHGTSKPELIGKAVSHGCIRMRNADIQRLTRLVRGGTPVQVRN
ncbi:MAG: L,D-transpeptidase [Actinobacteria bacterium]|nr:L,D-transpeptidase [Actinomycetota bacterium]